MSKGKTFKFNGSKVQIQKVITSPATTAITELTATNPATVKSTIKAKKGDIVTISGLEGFNGDYVVSAVDSSGALTLANTNWLGKKIPSAYTGSKIGLVQFFDNFCELKNIQKSGATVEQIDVSTICSEGKEYEAGDREEGSLTMQFFLNPNSPIQQALEEYEYSGEKFWVRLLLPQNQGTYIFNGSVETGINIDGQVAGRWESGLAMKLSGRRYFMGA